MVCSMGVRYCNDNGAMIAQAGWEMFRSNSMHVLYICEVYKSSTGQTNLYFTTEYNVLSSKHINKSLICIILSHIYYCNFMLLLDHLRFKLFMGIMLVEHSHYYIHTT